MTIIGPSLGDGPSLRTMPKDFSIAIRPATGTDTVRAGLERGERRQSMRGFEDTYVDIIDYIVRITHRIWEDQDVGYIYDTYAPGCFVYDDSGAHYGVERVVSGTMQSIHAFPDTRSYADDVIWAGDDEQGFVTSHRYITTGHHLGPWAHGPATGRPVNMWGIANCVVRENEIFEEWVLYNMCSKLAQLGIDVADAARRYGNEIAASPVAERYLAEVDRLAGGRKPEYYPAQTGTDFDPEHFARALFHNVYNRRDLSAFDRSYSSTVRWKGTSNRTGYGLGDVKGMARSLMATFPDLGMKVDEVYWMGNDEEGYRIVVRWTASGTHRGHGLYGVPTGRRAHLWGISQLYVRNGRVTEEWNLFNEFDVMAQLLSDAPLPMLP
ncbi:ester cyclase [Cryptosporangium sp. NPDC048952]|uniref:ester cyclase n=1 Tax=Cryptosporangium sp. NPDC048952 TaxID=3363961 RepID=UPI003717738B